MNIIAASIILSYIAAAITLGIANYRTVYLREYEHAKTRLHYDDLARSLAKANADLTIPILSIGWPVLLPIYLVWPTISKKLHAMTGVD